MALFDAHQGWVEGLARQFVETSLYSRQDLVQVGLIALWNKARTFDPARGILFRTHARARVVGAMRDEIRRVMGTRRRAASRDDRWRPVHAEFEPQEPAPGRRSVYMHGKKRISEWRECAAGCGTSRWMVVGRRFCSIRCSRLACFVDRVTQCSVCRLAFARSRREHTRCPECRREGRFKTRGPRQGRFGPFLNAGNRRRPRQAS